MTDEKGNLVCPDSSQETRLFRKRPKVTNAVFLAKHVELGVTKEDIRVVGTVFWAVGVLVVVDRLDKFCDPGESFHWTLAAHAFIAITDV